MVVKHGRVVRTRGEEQPYKVVLEHENGDVTEHPAATVREGEAMIRERSAAPAKPDRLREWSPLA